MLNVHYTTPTFLCFAASPEGQKWNSRGSYDLPRGRGRLNVEQSLSVDFDSQVLTTRLRFTEVSQDGSKRQERLSEWQSRYFDRRELEYLMEQCGLDILSVQGTYTGGPVAPGSQLIYETRPGRR